MCISQRSLLQTHWTECAEDDINFGPQSTKMDPTVKLHSNSSIMLTENLSMRDGLANGTHAACNFHSCQIMERQHFMQQPLALRLTVSLPLKSLMHSSATHEWKFTKPPSPWARRNKTESMGVTAVQIVPLRQASCLCLSGAVPFASSADTVV